MKKIIYFRRVTREDRGWWLASGTGHHPRGQRCTEREGHWRCLLTLCWSFLKPFLKLNRANEYNQLKQSIFKSCWRKCSDYKLLGKTWLLWCIFFIIPRIQRLLHNRFWNLLWTTLSILKRVWNIANHQHFFQNLNSPSELQLDLGRGLKCYWKGPGNAEWLKLLAGCPHHSTIPYYAVQRWDWRRTAQTTVQTQLINTL